MSAGAGPVPVAFFKTFAIWWLARERGLMPRRFDDMAVVYRKGFALGGYLTSRLAQGRSYMQFSLLQAESACSRNRTAEDLGGWEMLMRARSLLWRLSIPDGKAAIAILELLDNDDRASAAFLVSLASHVNRCPSCAGAPRRTIVFKRTFRRWPPASVSRIT